MSDTIATSVIAAHQAAVEARGWDHTTAALLRRDIQAALYVPTDAETLHLLAELTPPTTEGTPR